MKSFFAVMLLCALASTTVLADSLEYDLEVEGMKCAYCAYNVSKQLASLDGVVADSVDVDLEHGRVTLRSEKELQRTQMADLLLQAGFGLTDVKETVAATPQLQPQPENSILLSVTMSSERIGAGEFDAVLEALGAVAAKQSGRISVVGPGALETAILKPVLGGRQTVINVNYERADQAPNTVIRVDSARIER